jgi:uncharacterized membrane protein YqjE
MEDSRRIVPLTPNPGSLSTKDLLKTLVSDVTELVKTEVALAKAELKNDFKSETAMAKGLGAAALLGYTGLILLFVTAILALGHAMPDWAAGLLVSALVLIAAGVSAAIGWARRVRHPLERTRREAQATLALAKERFT